MSLAMCTCRPTSILAFRATTRTRQLPSCRQARLRRWRMATNCREWRETCALLGRLRMVRSNLHPYFATSHIDRSVLSRTSSAQLLRSRRSLRTDISVLECPDPLTLGTFTLPHPPLHP
jgi:hypothetical protein